MTTTGSDFNCTSCGLCCKAVTPELLKAHGLPEAPTGGCGHLQADNRCGIYETRPLLCRVRGAWEAVMQDEMSWDEWKTMNENACKELQEKAKP